MLARVVHGARSVGRRMVCAVRQRPFEEWPPKDVVRFAFRVMLRREPGADGLAHYVPAVAAGTMTPFDLVDAIRTSDEFRARTWIGPAALHGSLHLSRCEWITGLPPGRRVIDLGGTHTRHEWGALVLMGYPHHFEELVIVDLPAPDRHELYRSESWTEVVTWRGPARYHVGSMTDLSFAGDGTVDLVYSGQSIEHVSEADADAVMREAHRVLRPGGYFALDTPNGPVCRLGRADFIDPDHEVEYALDQLVAKLTGAGFTIAEAKGLNHAGGSVRAGTLDEAEVARNYGVFFDAESCYLLAILARKPGG